MIFVLLYPLSKNNFNYFLTAATTVNPCGTPVSLATSSSIYSSSSGSSSYTCHYFAWTASTTGSVTLAFQFRNDPNYWYMDDVSVSNETTELLVNGDFESGSLSPDWTTSTPNGQCSGSTGAYLVSSSCRSGSYCLSDGCCGCSDQVSQSFAVTTGQIYFISFWLQLSVVGGSSYGGGRAMRGRGGGSGNSISVSVTLS
jgi:hypothetical protein